MVVLAAGYSTVKFAAVLLVAAGHSTVPELLQSWVWLQATAYSTVKVAFVLLVTAGHSTVNGLLSHLLWLQKTASSRRRFLGRRRRCHATACVPIVTAG